ncbi:prepilin-type N-terminal cleavage/methylation domain-containing protein [Candidatus Fermentibacterales bacterium]|nr:prepilin-type N-terminal cleavage/methylation domain-containing protein [Candidatus Fermentibacterales bacterium]
MGSKSRRESGRREGMTLVELIVVIMILGVVLAGIYLIFLRTTEHYHFGRRQSELDISGRHTLERVTDELIWAGYMPYGGWDDDEWHPITIASQDEVQFYADFRPFGSLQPEDTVSISLNTLDKRVQFQDAAGSTWFEGFNIDLLAFNYLDQSGREIQGDPLVFPDSTDLVRHIQVDLTLSDIYAGNFYQTMMHTTVSPRNLGINHNINPAFWPPPPPGGIIIFNVASPDTQPSFDESEQIEYLLLRGFTVQIIADDEVPTFDFSTADLLVIHNEGGVHTHQSVLDSLRLPIVTMNPYIGIEFGIGWDYHLLPVPPATVSGGEDINDDGIWRLNPDHEVMIWSLPDPTADPWVLLYDTTGAQTFILNTDSVYGAGWFPDSLLAVKGPNADEFDATVAVVAEDDSLMRRVFFGCHDATAYNHDGWDLFYNVIVWGMMGPQQPPEPGDPITELEDFEGTGPGPTVVTLWDDPIIPNFGADTTIIYMEDFEDPLGLEWNLVSLSSAGRIQVGSGIMSMDRTGPGAATRNLAALTVDLSAYSELTDELLLIYHSRTHEGAADANDGVFFRDLSNYQVDTLYLEDFTSPPGDNPEFWGDLFGRWRRHNTWAGDGYFVTLDTRTSGNWAVNRMMVELNTSGFVNDQVFLDFDFEDHNEQSTSGDAGDFVGYNDHGIINGPVGLFEDLDPGAYADGVWHHRTVNVHDYLNPSSLPDPLYIVFGHAGDEMAIGPAANGGLSFDNIMVTGAGYADTTYDRFAIPGAAGGWVYNVVDLDDAAILHGQTFDADFEMVFSQYGGNPIPTEGRDWDNVKIGIAGAGAAVDGWTHGMMPGYGTDDWDPQLVSPPLDYAWTSWKNVASSYSPDCYCWLQSPEITIPGWITSPTLTFEHDYSFETGDDGGYMLISVNGGAWTPLTAASGLAYTGVATADNPIPDGTEIFTDASGGWVTETVDLTPYIGNDVRFRFILGSDAADEDGGWALDNFHAEGIGTGYIIHTIDFYAVDSALDPWNHFDVYLGTTASSDFTVSGELNKAAMQLSADDATLDVSATGWKSIPLDVPFALPAGTNLTLKIELSNAATGMNNTWWQCLDTGAISQCRHAGSDLGDPASLSLEYYKPNVILHSYAGVLSVATGTSQRELYPLCDNYLFNDFEAIYTATELGTTGADWYHEGTNDDWEIGWPLFVPAPDPVPPPSCGAHVAGNDLTDDGFYVDDAWSWMRSPAYPMAAALAYDTVFVRFDRCLRLEGLDNGFLQLAFTTDPGLPTTSLDWQVIRSYVGENHSIYETEEVDMTSDFNDNADSTFYMLRFVLDSGPWFSRGGWNLDNIQVFGRTAP